MFWPEQAIISDDNDKIERLTDRNEREEPETFETQSKNFVDTVKSSLGIIKKKSSVSLKRVFYDSRMNFSTSNLMPPEKENPERDHLLDSSSDKSEIPRLLIDRGTTDLDSPNLEDLRRPVSLPRLLNRSNPRINPDRLKFPENYRRDITKPIAFNKDKDAKEKEGSDALQSLIESHKYAMCTVKYIATDVICTVANTVMDVVEDPKTREATKQLAYAFFCLLQRKTMELLNLDKKDPCTARKKACVDLQKACDDINKRKKECPPPCPPKEKPNEPLIIIKSKLKNSDQEKKMKNEMMNQFCGPCGPGEEKKPCPKPEPCPKPDPCAKPDPCPKPCPKPDPCDPCAKPDPCDPCAKPDLCNVCSKPDPCDPCAKVDPCDPNAKPDPCDPCVKVDPCNPCSKPVCCPKPDPCERIAPKKNAPLEIPNPCLKIPDPCLKTEPEPKKEEKPCPKRQPQTQRSS